MQEIKIQLGSIVVSTQGRDKGESYVVVGFDKNKVLVADGKHKLLAKPKSKNALHLRITNFVNSELLKKLENKQKVNDQMIYHTLYEYQKSQKGEL